jgi:Nicotinate phosphoribosyltransferase C-terminal domain
MRQVRRLELPSLEDARRRAPAQLECLPIHLKRLETAPAYPVEVSASLQALACEIDRLEMAGS